MTVSTTETSSQPPLDNPPWYRLPIVWMVIGGPAVVVVAALATVVIAVKNVDPVLDTSVASTHREAPAAKARNHANEAPMSATAEATSPAEQ